ncbi:TetR/AcrR family transcriptional regulator [Microlunatus sp. GCM10028923]|uniref:TetR/AcrR family transcriptional regulator n=1 Tax=Microlunatus sp. GCM10028923 TaxID=3273400 RepID=UPI0036159796
MTSGVRGTGRPRKLTEQDIIDAVLAEGIAGATVPIVARRLAVSTMTLYRYTPSRADLLALAWNHVITTTSWPHLTGAWRELLREQSIAFWNVLADHPGVVTALSRGLMPAEMMNRIDDISAALIEKGFNAADAVLAVDLVIDLTIDHRRGVEMIHGLLQTPSTLDALAQLWAPRDTDPPHRNAARAAMQDAIRTPPFDWYTQKLDLALDGIEHRRANPTS